MAVSDVSRPSFEKQSTLRPKSTRPDKEYPATASWSSFEASLTRCAARSRSGRRYRAQEHSGLGQTPHRVPVGIRQRDNIVDDNDIFGDGVNVATRLEGLDEPGTAHRRGRLIFQVGCAQERVR